MCIWKTLKLQNNQPTIIFHKDEKWFLYVFSSKNRKSIYGRGISFTDLANIKKTDIKGFTLTYISQIPGLPRITVQWDAAMQEIADRYPSDSEFLFPFIKSTDMQMADCEVKRVRQNVMRAFKRIATRCNLSVVPSMGMVKDIYQRAIDGVSVSKII